jgi:hypothetical protein
MADAATGKPLGTLLVYAYKPTLKLETDVQIVFFTSMTLTDDGRALLIENERGHKFLVDLATRKTREVNHPCALAFVGAELKAGHWTVLLKLSVKNYSSVNFYVDRLSFGDSEELRNDLFEVRYDGVEIPYSGIMAKRTAPKGAQRLAARPDKNIPPEFILLKPDLTHTVEVNIGEAYPLPARGGELTVKYRHHNHFSPDDVDFFSNEVRVRIHPSETINRPPKPRP